MLKRRFKLGLILSFALVLAGQTFCPTASAQGESERASRARQINNAPVAEATVTLNEQFLNSFLDAMFTRLRGPQFPLSLLALSCRKRRQTRKQRMRTTLIVKWLSLKDAPPLERGPCSVRASSCWRGKWVESEPPSDSRMAGLPRRSLPPALTLWRSSAAYAFRAGPRPLSI